MGRRWRFGRNVCRISQPNDKTQRKPSVRRKSALFCGSLTYKFSMNFWSVSYFCIHTQADPHFWSGPRIDFRSNILGQVLFWWLKVEHYWDWNESSKFYLDNTIFNHLKRNHSLYYETTFGFRATGQTWVAWKIWYFGTVRSFMFVELETLKADGVGWSYML